VIEENTICPVSRNADPVASIQLADLDSAGVMRSLPLRVAPRSVGPAEDTGDTFFRDSAALAIRKTA
jgi:hypothetical protein